MDQRLPYEEIISGKLQSLPIPDLADAIWARVERQLDTDMPTDDGGSGPAPRSGPRRGAIGWGASLFIIALVAIYFTSKKDPQVIEPKTRITAPTNQPTQSDKALQQPDTATNTRRGQPPALTNSPPFKGRADSLFEAAPAPTAVLPTVIDSVLAQKEELVTAQHPQDSVKKKRGVSGLKDSDYRIVPKKDNR